MHEDPGRKWNQRGCDAAENMDCNIEDSDDRDDHIMKLMMVLVMMMMMMTMMMMILTINADAEDDNDNE